MTPFRAKRRGALLLIVLIALAVVAALVTAVVRTTLSDQRAMRREIRDIQASWLAESGLERAAARLHADPDYKGETWNISAKELDADAGVVLIEVQPDPKNADLRVVRARADYPNHPRQRSRHTKQLIVEVSS